MPLDNDFLWDMYETVKLYSLEYWYKFRQLISGAGTEPENRFLDKDIERVKALRNNISIINTTSVPKNNNSFLSNSLRKHYSVSDVDSSDPGFISSHKWAILNVLLGAVVITLFLMFFGFNPFGGGDGTGPDAPDNNQGARDSARNAIREEAARIRNMDAAPFNPSQSVPSTSSVPTNKYDDPWESASVSSSDTTVKPSWIKSENEKELDRVFPYPEDLAARKAELNIYEESTRSSSWETADNASKSKKIPHWLTPNNIVPTTKAGIASLLFDSNKLDVIPEDASTIYKDALAKTLPLESTPSPSSELTGGSTETPKTYSEAVSSSIATNSTLDNTTSTPIDAVTDVKGKSKS